VWFQSVSPLPAIRIIARVISIRLLIHGFVTYLLSMGRLPSSILDYFTSGHYSTISSHRVQCWNRKMRVLVCLLVIDALCVRTEPGSNLHKKLNYNVRMLRFLRCEKSFKWLLAEYYSLLLFFLVSTLGRPPYTFIVMHIGFIWFLIFVWSVVVDKLFSYLPRADDFRLSTFWSYCYIFLSCDANLLSPCRHVLFTWYNKF